MSHDIEYAVALKDPTPCGYCNVMPVSYGEVGINFEVHIHQEQISHFSHAEIVHSLNAFT